VTGARAARLLAGSLAVGLALLVAGPGATAGAASTAATAGAAATAAAKPATVTVTGPHMYIPGTTNSHYATASTVTVSQTTHLINQMLDVSWTNFTPSSQETPNGLNIYNYSNTNYPVMLAQCDTLKPTTPDQCYDATLGGTTTTGGEYGPSNTSFGVTAANGSGSADIEIYTSVENQWLNCGPSHPCSLVVMPAQGGNSLTDSPPDCADHTYDTNSSGGTATGQYTFTELDDLPNGLCSWERRIVIPLYFSPTPSGCPLRTANFTAGGSPMLERAMEQWQSGICTGSDPITIQYNSSLSEAEARSEFADGLYDVAFTTQPLTSGTTTTRKYTYAPVAVSSVALAYWLDNYETGQPYTDLRLDARLVAKLLTTSYQFSYDGCPGAERYTFGCDNAVDNNPENLFADPEFKALNPGITYPADSDGFQIPIVPAGESDMTWTTTSWISADSEASSFLSGTFDEWGMHVNTNYEGVTYPTNSFTAMDPYVPVADRYLPVYPEYKIAQYLAENWEPGTQDTKDPTTGNYDSLTPQVPGDRDLFAITDTATANAFLFPTAALENHAGAYVEPTDASMAAALNDMTVNPDGITEAFNQDSDDKNAYPLTMIIYAVVPTSGLSQATASKISQFLDYAATSGQTAGTSPGELAEGYLPLTQKLRAQTLKAAQEVLDQSGDTTKTSSTTPSPGRSSSAASPSASPSPSPSASPENARQVAVSFSEPDSAGLSWVVLALLIAGGVFAVGGPTALLYGSPGARTAVIDAVGRIRRTRIRRKKP
jgi:hypothetical protein